MATDHFGSLETCSKSCPNVVRPDAVTDAEFFHNPYVDSCLRARAENRGARSVLVHDRMYARIVW